MSLRDSLENSKEDKHLKFDIADEPRKSIEKMKEDDLQKLDSPGRSEKQRKSSENIGELKLGKFNSGKARKKVEENKKPMPVTRQVKNLKSNKRNFTNAFKPVVMRDAETMTDLLRIFESPSKSVVSMFKSTPFHLQEIEVMTDLTGEEVADEVGLKDMETTTEDLAVNVLEMTNDLDYMNLKLLEDEKERKKSVAGVGGELDQNIPEESDGVYGNLMERMYVCRGITPVETIKRDEVGKQVQDKKKVSEVKLEEVKEEEVVGSKLEKQESLRSADTMYSTLEDEEGSTDNLSQLRDSSMRSTMRDSVDASENIEEEVNYEGDGNEEEKSLMEITEEKSVMAITEEKSVMGFIEEQQEPLSIEDGVVEDVEEVVIKEEEEETDIDEIQEGLMYTELNEAYHFRELFDVDESEVYVEENINFGSEEDIYREDVRGSNEGWFHIKGGEEREPEESATEILVRRATMTEDTGPAVEGDSEMDLYRSTLLAEVVVDEEYQNITEKLFTEEEVEEFQDNVEVYEDTVEIDKYVGVYIDDHMDFYTEIELNYPRYDDEWEIPKVIEALREDQSIGKVLNDFGLLEDLEEETLQIHFRPTFESDTIGRLDSSTVSFLEEATKYAEQITHLSELDAATAKVSSQFRVSMIYNEEPGSHIDEKEIQSLLKKEESSANMENWLRRQSLRTEILDVDQSPYIVRSEMEYDRDLDLHTREFENSVVDDLKFGVRSSEEIEKKEVEDDSSSEMTASLGSSAGSNMEILSNNEFYPRILDEAKNSSAHSSTLSLLKKFQTGGRKPNKDESVSMILYNEGDKDYYDDDDEDDDDSSISESNQDSVDVILELIRSDPYGSYITHKMLNMLEYFKKVEFQNEVPHKLKALEALLVKKAARKKFTETLQLKSAKHSESNIDNYSCKPEIFNDSVSVLVWNIFNCFFLPISSKISHRMSSSQTSKSRKQVIPKLQTVMDGTPKKEEAKLTTAETGLKISGKVKKPLAGSTWTNVIKPPVNDDELNSIAIQTGSPQEDVENIDEIEKNDEFVIVRRYKTMETQTDVSFVTKIKEEEALIEKTFAVHHHTAAQTDEFSPEFLDESFESRDGTLDEAEEDEFYWKNVENIFTDDLLVQEQLAKISSKKGRSPLEILITVGKDGRKLFAPLRSDKSLEEAMDPRLEQFLAVLNETSVANLFEDLLHQPLKSEISRGGRLSGDIYLQPGKKESLPNQDVDNIAEKPRRVDSKGAGSVLQKADIKQSSSDIFGQTSTEKLVTDHESISDCEEKERQDLEEVIKTGIQFLEASDLDEEPVKRHSTSSDELPILPSSEAVCHSSLGSLRRFYTLKFLDSLDNTSNFSSVITVSEVNDNEIEFMSDSGMGQPRQGERTILKGGLQEQKKSVTVFREIQLKDIPPVYDTDKDFQQKAEVKPMRKYISFRQKPRRPKPLLVKNWLVKNDQDEWIMVKQYHLFKKIHNYPDTYGSIDRISKDEEVDRQENVTIGGNPIRGVLFSYFFPKSVFKYGISRTDRGNIEYLRRSDVAWSRIAQKNPERDPYHRNNALPLGFTKNYLKIEKHSSLLRSPEHSSSISSPRNESMDSSYEFVQMLKMEGEKVSPVASPITKPDLPPPITVYEAEKVMVERKVDEEIVLKNRNYQKFKTDELQNILLELVIDNFVNYDIDIFEKTLPLQESDEDVEGKSKTGENEECFRQKCKSSTETNLMRASLTSLTDDAINDLSFTESELQVICSQTLKSKRILEQADVKSYQSAEDIVLSKRDLKEFVNLLSGPKIVENKDLNSFESDAIHFSLENVGCLNMIFSSVELVEGGKHIVRVANLNQNQVLKFVKSILREIYLHILSLSEKFNTATCVDGNSKDLLEVGSVHRIETLSSGMLYLNEIVNKISLQEFSSKDDEDLESKNTYVILVSPKDLEIIREKFVERSLPLVKLLGRKDLCNKFPLVFTKSETSLLNMIYLNENIGKVSDNLIEEEVTYKDSLIDLIHSVQKSLSNKFSDSSVVDIRMALTRFENDWMMSRKCNDQNPEKCAISNWVEKLCSSKHYSQPDREGLKEVLRKITSSMDHLDKLEEYLESKKYAERRIIGQDLDEMESEVEVFEDDEKTRKAVKVLKNILINRILSAHDLLLPTGVEPVVSEISFLGEDSESFVGSIDYSDSKSGEIRERTLGDASSFDNTVVKRETRTSSLLNSSECTSGEIFSLVSPSKFPYLKAPQLPYMRKISDKTRILKFLSQECDYEALKRLKSVKQKKKTSSVVEKCVGKVDFKLIHYRRSKFKRKLTLIRDRKMMYNTYFSYGIGSKPDKSLPILGKKLGDVPQGDDFCKDDGRLSNCETCFETEQSSLSSLSNDLRHPLFPEDSLDSVELVDDERYNEDECNAKLTRIREDIKNAKKYTPLKEKVAMPRINEVDTNDLSLNRMTSILDRRVRHLKNIVTGNWSESMTSLLGSSKLESGSNTSSKTLLNLPEITEPCTIQFDSKTPKTSFSRKSSSSRASSENLKLPAITDPKPKEKSISTKKSFKEKRSSSSVKTVPLCVKLSEEFSEQNLESKQVTKRDRANYRMVASLKCDYQVRRDLMNLLEEPKKLPYLKPPPEYTPVPGFGDHPLLKFKLAESHVAQVHSFRMEKALKKAQFYKFSSEGETETNEEVQFMDPTKCITQPPWFPVSVVPRIMQCWW
ncbi:uncharacterized protein LOC120352730 isoform X2 [Nilaparvata lugens]|uniref:uncharacterized protein LOC120352730 isoform X2 n=1 Tax=Nilaparvata lugens TaxID=108931 RepID=UPI00193D4358|nr:uncharacterized protein LOC120352730 isoform X2 [Nilaparvata lugens]